MRKKILLVESSTGVTGALTAAIEIASALKNDFEVVFVVPRSGPVTDCLDARKIPWVVVPMLEISKRVNVLFRYPVLLVRNSHQVYRILKSGGFDILIINDFYNLIGGGVRLLGYKGKILTFVRLRPATQMRVLSRFWILWAFRFSDKVVAISRTVDREIKAFGKSAVRLEDPKDPSDALFALHLPKVSRARSFVSFIFVGNYNVGKGHLVALEAFERMSMKLQASLTFVGSDMGNKKNILYKRELERFVAGKGLSSRVAVRGPVGNVWVEMRQHDVLINCSKSESFSQTVLEGMMMGLPVIATRCGGPEQLIQSGVDGVLVEVGDVEGLAAAMDMLVKNPATRDRLGKCASARWLNAFSPDSYRGKFCDLFGYQRSE